MPRMASVVRSDRIAEFCARDSGRGAMKAATEWLLRQAYAHATRCQQESAPAMADFREQNDTCCKQGIAQVTVETVHPIR
jgi:hypothetical protein